MSDAYKVMFSGDSINTGEDIQNIRKSVEEKEFDILMIDKKSLLSLIDYVERLQEELESEKNDINLSGGL